ncbi:hypothetical protein B0H15DRAFT_598706 [Mycena belliarum]|uniref:Uncharacterized protein n=1 Tax=Mycena belliarum TaxID=1033014 RepID=A0AAD6TSX1_9AGAR|nr:hypothetical protein B0H15DRAFT_598706 [Mycena belliae]
MDKGVKRKRDSRIPSPPPPPILVYSAPNYSRFAKLFTETSLEEIKEIVRKRLKLSSISDFLLFYDTDIALENEDDFNAFMVHARSAESSVHVVVKVLSPSHDPTPTASEPSEALQNVDPAELDNGARRSAPPRKKRKMASEIPDRTTSISSATSQKNLKVTAPLTEGQSVSASATVASTGPSEGQERKKKRKKNAIAPDADGATTQAGVSQDTKNDSHVPHPPPSADRSRKKPKQTAANEHALKSVASVDTRNPSDVAPQVGTEDRRREVSQKPPEQRRGSLPQKSSIPKKATKKSKKDTRAEDAPDADDPAQKQNALEDQSMKGISAPSGETLTETESVPGQRQKGKSNVESSLIEKSKKPKRKNTKVVEQGAVDKAQSHLIRSK